MLPLRFMYSFHCTPHAHPTMRFSVTGDTVLTYLQRLSADCSRTSYYRKALPHSTKLRLSESDIQLLFLSSHLNRYLNLLYYNIFFFICQAFPDIFIKKGFVRYLAEKSQAESYAKINLSTTSAIPSWSLSAAVI